MLLRPGTQTGVMLMYDGDAILIGYGEPTYDAYGNEIQTEIRTPVYVMPGGVYASEFYAAGQNNLHPSISFRIANRADYNGERLIEYEGRTYTIIRPDWNPQHDGITLICEERING